jgi:two-component system cell cycle sensor histidine kinase/response regulator CckA
VDPARLAELLRDPHVACGYSHRQHRPKPRWISGSLSFILISTAATQLALFTHEPESRKQAAMSPTPGTETILVVDDEPLVLSLANSMLTRFGYNAITAASGKEALRLFDKWPTVEVDLALVDLVMPEMNGVDLVERIHQLRPGLPVLYFSAYPAHDTLRPKFARYMPYIAKPFTSLQLTSKIREVLDAGKSDAAEAGST